LDNKRSSMLAATRSPMPNVLALEMDDRPFGGRRGRARDRQFVHPGRERRLVLAGDHPRGQLILDELAADRGVEPVEADR